MRKHSPIIIIIAVSLITHFLFFGHPREVVFDEVHFGKFISGYFTQQYFFDIHPPLGKLLISGMGYLGGFQPGFGFAEIGQKFPDNLYLWLRFLPTLAGALLPLVIFFLALELGLSRITAFLTAMLTALDGALLVQSRSILLDSFLLLFGFSGLLFYLKYRRNGRTLPLLAAGVLGALSFSVKWTGASFLALMLIIEIIERRPSLKNLAFLILIPLSIYSLILALHLGILPKSGPGDAYMTLSFQKSLIGNVNASNSEVKPLNLPQKIIELNLQLYKYNATLNSPHPYASKWYSWPFMARPIYYWHEAAADKSHDSRIYLLGNPAVWWLSAIAVIYAVVSLTIDRKAFAGRNFYIILGAYFLNLLPFVGIKRPMFLYHYLAALIFSILLLGYLIDKLKHRKKIALAVLAVSAIAFVYFAPLWYGLPLTPGQYNARVWFPAWK